MMRTAPLGFGGMAPHDIDGMPLDFMRGAGGFDEYAGSTVCNARSVGADAGGGGRAVAAAVAAPAASGQTAAQFLEQARKGGFEPTNVPTMPWFQEMLDNYLASSASFFIVEGNTNDLMPYPMAEGVRWCMGANDYLMTRFADRKSLIASYDLNNGLRVLKDGKVTNAALALHEINQYRKENGLEPLESYPTTAVEFVRGALQALAKMTTAKGNAILMRAFDMIAYAKDLGFSTDDEKAAILALSDLPTQPEFMSGNNLVIGITDRASELSPRVANAPGVHKVHASFPDLEMRRLFLYHEVEALSRGENGDKLRIAMPLDQLATITNGLTLIDLRNLLKGARQTGQEVTYKMISERKKKTIEEKCKGLVEFIDAGHGLDDVAGMEGAKTELQRMVRLVQSGRKKEVPMGIGMFGAQGTGKSYLAEAFARDSGMTCIKLGNIKNKYVGKTEENLNMVLDLLDALGNVCLVIDEAESFLSRGGGEDDGGTNAAIIARLKEYMADTKHRGDVVMIFMSNRPELMDIDLLRPGRIDLKLPLFYPESADERGVYFNVTARKLKLKLDKGVTWQKAAEGSDGYSAADISEIVRRAAVSATEAGHEGLLKQEDIDFAAANFQPTRNVQMIEFMELQAVMQASDRNMLPERYRSQTTEALESRLEQLQMEIRAKRMGIR